MNHLEEFLEAMAASGCATDSHIFPDDKIHRAHAVDDKPQKLNITYQLAIEGDFAFGWWRDHKRGATEKWYAKKPNMSAAEHAAMKAKINERRAAAEKDRRKAAQDARIACEAIWNRATTCISHAYLTRKGVASYGLRLHHGLVVLPACTDQGIQTLQFITEQGAKRFKRDGTKKGAWFTIAGTREIVGVCEGYATGASVHEATGWEVCVVFDSGNMKASIAAIRKKYPDAHLVICADDDKFVFQQGKRPAELDAEKTNWPAGDSDEWNKWRGAGLLTNPGLEAAESALKAAGGNASIKTPKFENLASRPTDFNDMHALQGIDALRELLLAPSHADDMDIPPHIFEDIPIDPPEDMREMVPCFDEDSIDPPIMQGPFKIMGYNKGFFYYLPRDAGQLVILNAAGHTEQNLKQLAPLEWWSERFGTKKGVSWSHVSNALIQTCYKQRVFTLENRIRDCGIWRDKGRVVAHLGDHLWVDGVRKEIYDIGSAYVYEKTAPIFEISQTPLDDLQARKLFQICDFCSWSNQLSATLLSGWLVIAPLCGLLEWRPHIWLDGETGAGKSFVMNKIIKPVLGNMAMRVSQGSSEAGLRRAMAHGARPFLMDEMEAETEKDVEMMRSILLLARKSSSGDTILQADQKTGGTVEYNIYSVFCMSSINSSVSKRADKTRFSHLHLKRNTSPDARQHFRDLKAFVSETLTEQYSRDLLARTLANIQTLIKNSLTFNEAAEEVFQMQRASDQIGVMLAGAYLLHSTKEVSYDAALEWIKKHEWHEHTALSEQTDQEQLFGHLMTTRINVIGSSKRHETQIGKAIMVALGQEDASFISSEAIAALEAIDIKIRGDEVWIRKPSQHIDKFLNKTPWHASWAEKLIELPGIEKTKSPKREGSSSAHQVIISAERFRNPNRLC